MKIIRKYSYKCADGLTKELNENNEKRRVYYYGFQIVLGGIVKIVLLVLITLLAGIFTETMTMLAFYSLFRLVAGGYHMDDYTNCMVVSIAMFVGFGLFMKYTLACWSVGSLALLTAATFAAVLFCVIRYAPADTPFKPLNNPEHRRRLKSLSIIEVFIWLIIDLFLLQKGYMFPMLAGCLAMILGAFIISPVGYAFFDIISCGMQKFRKCIASRNA